MGQGDETLRSSEDPAEALADLAAGADQAPAQEPAPSAGEADPSAALSRLAEGGEDVPPEQPGADAGEKPGVEDVVALGAGADPLEIRRRRAASVDRQQARVHSHAYKRVMIPLLVVVAGLLLLVGVLCGVMLLSSSSQDIAEDARRSIAGLMIVSFPLGGFLFFGAWWFRRDLRGG